MEKVSPELHRTSNNMRSEAISLAVQSWFSTVHLEVLAFPLLVSHCSIYASLSILCCGLIWDELSAVLRVSVFFLKRTLAAKWLELLLRQFPWSVLRRLCINSKHFTAFFANSLYVNNGTSWFYPTSSNFLLQLWWAALAATEKNYSGKTKSLF